MCCSSTHFLSLPFQLNPVRYGSFCWSFPLRTLELPFYTFSLFFGPGIWPPPASRPTSKASTLSPLALHSISPRLLTRFLFACIVLLSCMFLACIYRLEFAVLLAVSFEWPLLLRCLLGVSGCTSWQPCCIQRGTQRRSATSPTSLRTQWLLSSSWSQRLATCGKWTTISR